MGISPHRPVLRVANGIRGMLKSQYPGIGFVDDIFLNGIVQPIAAGQQFDAIEIQIVSVCRKQLQVGLCFLFPIHIGDHRRSATVGGGGIQPRLTFAVLPASALTGILKSETLLLMGSS